MPDDDTTTLERNSGFEAHLWFCPIPGHSTGDWATGIVQTVQWRGGVAYCLAPDCGRTSADKIAEETA